ncbi:MAG: hypothetical protein H6834_17535 [Planctomycetes bacterium]|nr:hypothetical protein [Planctomycetota bacterium]
MNEHTSRPASLCPQGGAVSLAAIALVLFGAGSLLTTSLFSFGSPSTPVADVASVVQDGDQDEHEGKEGREQDEDEDDESSVGQHMKAIGRVQKGLGGLLKSLTAKSSDEDYARGIDLAREAQMHVLAAKNDDPSKMAKLPEKDRMKFAVEYRKAMKGFLNGWLDLEIALMEHDVSAAQKAFKSVGAMKKDGHDAFKGKKERGEGGGRGGRGR